MHVAVDRGKPVPRGLAVRGHRLLDLGSQQALGFPVVSPERAWLQLAETLALDELIAAGDHLVKREAPQSTIERLVSSVKSWHGRGALHARAALVDVRCGTDSPRETWMRLVMVRAGLPEPVIGYRAHDTLGRYLGRPDLAYVECKISIEYEGDGHRSDPKIFQQDIARRERFEDAGWRVIRVTGHDFQHPDAFVARVRRILASRS